jgi:phage gp36-like protein
MARYATIADLDISGLPMPAFGNLSPIQIQGALDRASDFADSFIGDKFTLPLLVPYPGALVDAVCQIAAWRLLCLRGFNPDNGADSVVRQGFLDARDWLTRVANGQARLAVVQTQPDSLQPNVSTSEQRGYGYATGDGIPGGNWGL